MQGLYFLILLLLVTALDLLVPYLLIGRIPHLGASYLFWSGLTLLVVFFAIFYTRKWRDQA